MYVHVNDTYTSFEKRSAGTFISVLNFWNAHRVRKHRIRVQRVKPVGMGVRGGFALRAPFLSCLEFTSYVANGTFILLGMQPSKTFGLIRELR